MSAGALGDHGNFFTAMSFHAHSVIYFVQKQVSAIMADSGQAVPDCCRIASYAQSWPDMPMPDKRALGGYVRVGPGRYRTRV